MGSTCSHYKLEKEKSKYIALLAGLVNAILNICVLNIKVFKMFFNKVPLYHGCIMGLFIFC